MTACWMCGVLAKALAKLMAEVAAERTNRLVTVPLPLRMAEDDARAALSAWQRMTHETERTGG